MGIFHNTIKDISNEATHSSNRAINTVAKIDEIDEENNTCNVTYIDDSGNKATAKKVMVDLRNTDWFPKENEIVSFDADGYGGGTIISSYTEDYKKDIGSKKEVKNDIYPDGDETCGGTIS